MELTVVPVTPFQQNSSVLRCPLTGRGALVDPGGEPERLLAAARARKVEIETILLTHAHVDHAGAAAALARELGVPIVGPHPGDRFWIESLAEQGRMFGLGPSEPFEPERWLDEGDRAGFGEVELEVRHCPGHTPGHVVFFHREMRVALVGDVLFAGSIGRTDFPGGDYDTLIRSITEKLLPLGDDVAFVPGHGPGSTFGEERRTNPFLVDPERYRSMV
jgi:glyoxylase-like metal-dependent hydrolase (beta-lactamase superfamily II)